MADIESPHLRLQQQIDCQLETNPREALFAWEKNGWRDEPGTDIDEAPLKYMALVMLDTIEERATRFTMDKDEGVSVHADSTYRFPKPPLTSLPEVWRSSERSRACKADKRKGNSHWE